MNKEDVEITSTERGRTLVLGDIHAAHKALLQCLDRSGFNNEEDTLISLGDIVDGWSQSYECVEELLKIKNLVAIRGNHDQWFNDFIKTGKHGSQWTQGAAQTAKSYLRAAGWDEGFVNVLTPSYIPLNHREFFANQENYHIVRHGTDDILFVHGGYDRHREIRDTPENEYYWDRDMWSSALSFNSMIKGGVTGKIVKWKTKDNFREIYIGHTTTENWGTTMPMKGGGDIVYNLDTGAGWSGYLTIMNIETKQFWQSDRVADLYPDEKGRR